MYNTEKLLWMNLYLTIPDHCMTMFFPVLQDGLKIQTDLGCSVRQLLCVTFDISSDYIEERIPTIMLNGKVIEDIDGAILEKNACLALSAAMPGLVGATLRRGGHLSPMRSGITYRENKTNERFHRGTIIIKLFNVLTRELGLKLLYKGIAMCEADVLDLLRYLSNPLKDNCMNVIVDDREVTVAELLEMKIFADVTASEIFLKIKPDTTPT